MRRYSLSTRIRSGLVGSHSGNCGGRADRPNPWAEDLAHRAEGQILAPLQKIDEGAVVAVISDREENIMAIAVALDDDLVGAAPQHRASPPALAPVHPIAETDGELAQINLRFENLEFALLVHQHTFSFPDRKSTRLNSS